MYQNNMPKKIFSAGISTSLLDHAVDWAGRMYLQTKPTRTRTTPFIKPLDQ